jgi:hypothetical protein
MSVRYALLFGTGGFALVSISSYWNTLNAPHALIYGGGLFFILSLIGFMVGHILNNPKGKGKTPIGKFFRDLFTLQPPPPRAIYELPEELTARDEVVTVSPEVPPS